MQRNRLIYRGAGLCLMILIAAGLLGSCAGLRIDRSIKQGSEDWGTLGGGMGRANKSISYVKPPLKVVWQYEAGGGITATPLVRDGILIVCTLKGELHAVNVETGKRIGYVQMDGAVTGTPVWNGVVLYAPISTEDETIESMTLQDGARNWTAKLGPSESSPLLVDRYLYVTSLNGILYCLNISSGEEVWKFKTAVDENREPIHSSPATDGNVIVFGCDDGAVYAVERATGAQDWKFQTGESVFASPIVTHGRVIIGSLDGKVYCLESVTGRLLWKFDTGSGIFGAASTNDTLAFVGATDGTCYALDINSGVPVWKFKAKSVFNSAPLVVDDLLYVGSLDRNLYVLKIETGEKVWNYVADGRIKVSPVIWNGILFVTSEDSYVTALKE